MKKKFRKIVWFEPFLASFFSKYGNYQLSKNYIVCVVCKSRNVNGSDTLLTIYVHLGCEKYMRHTCFENIHMQDENINMRQRSARKYFKFKSVPWVFINWRERRIFCDIKSSKCTFIKDSRKYARITFEESIIKFYLFYVFT